MRRFLFAGAAALLLVAAPARAQQNPPAARPDTTRRAPVTAPAARPDTTRRAPVTAPAARPDTARPAAATPDTTSPVPSADTVTARRDTLRIRRVGSGTAFYRSLLIPGWGQISTHSYTRAGVFITLQGASWFMLVKTLRKLSQAEAELNHFSPLTADSLLHDAADSLANQGLTPAALKIKADSLSAGFSLTKSRKKQREDWITLVVFWTLASGADAFIGAQLQDFPAGVGVEPREGGGARISVNMPVRTLLHPGDLLHLRKPLPVRSDR